VGGAPTGAVVEVEDDGIHATVVEGENSAAICMRGKVATFLVASKKEVLVDGSGKPCTLQIRLPVLILSIKCELSIHKRSHPRPK